eukprot:9120837-Alexandrium_andersonii.AAC.1
MVARTRARVAAVAMATVEAMFNLGLDVRHHWTILGGAAWSWQCSVGLLRRGACPGGQQSPSVLASVRADGSGGGHDAGYE